MQCGLGGSPHEQLPWFPPLAIASRQGICLKEDITSSVQSTLYNLSEMTDKE